MGYVFLELGVYLTHLENKNPLMKTESPKQNSHVIPFMRDSQQV